MKHLLLISFFILIGLNQAYPQTVGLIQHDAESLDNGYVLFAPINATTTYLIDKCGRLVKSWNSAYKAGQSVYLLPDGALFRTCNTNNTTFVAGGQGGRVEMIDWDGNVTWSYTVSDATQCQHHDAKVLPNGNVLILAWDSKTRAEAIAQGRNPSLVPSTVWSEKIIEVQPTGSSGGIIVWEWKLWDHLVQEYDATKPNYATVAGNPQLQNLNYAASATLKDWVHMNAIDYNPALDQILLSAHNMNEIWIIDHSTTTAQAAGHSGGNSTKGGDLLYRWGNPRAYNNGTTSDQKFFGQHNAYWIESGLPFENQIMVFNNGLARTGGNYSTVEIINPPVEGYNYTATLPYLPVSNSWIYNEGNPNNYFANNVSGAQQLSNGNVIMCNGPAGTFTEVTSSGTTVWKYINPVTPSGIINQGSPPVQNIVFRCPFYADDYSGFANHTLIAGSILENSNPVSDACALSLGINETTLLGTFQIYPNPAFDFITLSGLKGETKIFNSQGKLMWLNKIDDIQGIDVSAYSNGLYFVQNNNSVNKFVIVRK